MKRKLILSCVVTLLLLCGCSDQKKKDEEKAIQEVVLYIEEKSENWIHSDAVFEPVASDRIDAFNDRLKEMGIDLKLVVKMYPACNTLEKCSMTAENIIQHDPKADIISFHETYLDELYPLDEYLETEDGKAVMKEMSEDRVKTLRINDVLYQIPRMNYPLVSAGIYIDAAYEKEHHAILESLKGDPKGILTYFKDQYVEDQDWILSDGLEFIPFISDAYQEVPNTPLFIRKQDGKIVNPYEEDEIKDLMRMFAEIRWKGLTGKNLSYDKLQEIVSKGNMILSSSIGLSERIPRKLVDKIKLDMSNEYYTWESGLSILKDSKHKEEAFKILTVMNTDEKAAFALQYGPNPKRNSEGIIVDDMHRTEGSWNGLGNNMIIESAENEIPDKKEYFKHMEDTSNVHKAALYPSVFDLTSFAAQLDDFQTIMLNSNMKDTSITACMACTVTGDIQDPDAFMKEIEKVNQKLKAAGIDQMIQDLQAQLDQWLEHEA